MMSTTDEREFLTSPKCKSKYNIQPIKTELNITVSKRQVKMWTESEDKLLVNLHNSHGNNWIKISENFQNRTPSQCIQRWRRKFQLQNIRKGWTPEEDKKLLKLVQEYGSNWKILSSFFSKTGKQIRERYINKLDPTIKTQPFSYEEDAIIVESLNSFGTKWNLISKRLQGRPQNSIKNRFYSHLKKRINNDFVMDNSKLEDVKTEKMQESEIEALQDEENLGLFPNFLNNESFKPIFRIENFKDENSQENLMAFQVKREVSYLSDEHFLNKYIDFN